MIYSYIGFGGLISKEIQEKTIEGDVRKGVQRESLLLRAEKGTGVIKKEQSPPCLQFQASSQVLG